MDKSPPNKDKVRRRTMNTYIILIRGINVGGRNKVPMASLRQCLEGGGFFNVLTHISSGNVILESDRSPEDVKNQIEEILPKSFKLDSELIKVHVLSRQHLQGVIDRKPEGFGEQPDKYHSDVIFLIDITTARAMTVFNPKEGVDKIWVGDGVIYSQRLSALRTQSRLSRIKVTPAYKSMTVRTWNTTLKLSALLQSRT